MRLWHYLVPGIAALIGVITMLPGPLHPAPGSMPAEGTEVLGSDRVWIPIDLSGVTDLQLFLDRLRLGEGNKTFRSGCDKRNYRFDEALGLQGPVWLAIGDEPERSQCTTRWK